jgi:ribonuclease I
MVPFTVDLSSAVYGLKRMAPLNCGSNTTVPDSVVHDMADLMPTRGLVVREWTQHGACTGLSPERFFAMLRQAYQSVNVPSLGDRVGALYWIVPSEIWKHGRRSNTEAGSL